ncbi:glutamine amidotransferase-related protein [Ferrimonas balearica]|uniref:glutamine amidotransferase-related protein n=1 Tax=Ferrimonas balearica TaxID=44012 RepID=UPI001C99632F|nr:gamma-glutamyl-gamma-aminobutyrate hydrolase family protein [Ferrimonas balearica]MBY5990832.1 gamma-glutamyl-gamma-aminobutyrate hydrolase family protein [Ferrimonas balearica]
MVIGILDCDKVDPALAVDYGQYGEMFEAGFNRVRPGTTCRLYDAQGDALPEVTECDAWVISGSRHSAYEPLEWIQRLSAWVPQAMAADRPIAGICFGHQLLAQALGGQVAKATQGWGMGPYETRVVSPAPWFPAGIDRWFLLSSHQDQVQTLPAGATLLASSDFCPNYSFVIEDKVFTVQGHPEFPVGYNRALADKRRAQIGEAVYRQAQAGFARPVDSDRFLASILDFLQRRY